MFAQLAPRPLDLHVYRISIGRPLVLWCFCVLGILGFSAMAIFALPGLGIPAACLFAALLYYFIWDYRKSCLEISPAGVVYRELGIELKTTWAEISDLRVDRRHEAFITAESMEGPGPERFKLRLIGSSSWEDREIQLISDRRYIPLGLFSFHLHRGDLRGLILKFAPHLHDALEKMDAPPTDAERDARLVLVILILGLLAFSLLMPFLQDRYIMALAFLDILACHLAYILLKKRQEGSALASAQRKKDWQGLGISAAIFTVAAFIAVLIMGYREWSTLIILGVFSPIVALGAVVRAFLFFRSKNWLFGVLASLTALVAAPLALLAVSNLVEAIAHPATITNRSSSSTTNGQTDQPGEAGDAASLLKRLTALIDRGDALRAQDQFADALKTYSQSFDLASRLAKRQPHETNWQLELSIINNRVGDVLRDQRELAGALQSYLASVAIGQRLVKQSPINVSWQSELASSYERVGDISQQQNQWPEAAAGFTHALEIVRPWMAKPNREASWISTFSYCAMSRWKVLRDAPEGAVTIDRAEALADLHTARDAMEEARKTGGAPSSDESLPFVEEFLSAEDAREPGKR